MNGMLKNLLYRKETCTEHSHDEALMNKLHPSLVPRLPPPTGNEFISSVSLGMRLTTVGRVSIA